MTLYADVARRLVEVANLTDLALVRKVAFGTFDPWVSQGFDFGGSR